jgi:hypothetical protein
MVGVLDHCDLKCRLTRELRRRDGRQRDLLDDVRRLERCEWRDVDRPDGDVGERPWGLAVVWPQVAERLLRLNTVPIRFEGGTAAIVTGASSRPTPWFLFSLGFCCGTTPCGSMSRPNQSWVEDEVMFGSGEGGIVTVWLKLCVAPGASPALIDTIPSKSELAPTEALGEA